ncbi:MAG: hypothetical protein GY715_03985 [Planctomycetes bacterium]|nr:hypothetical protein [Planctomycetota bacterium]
MSDHSAFLNRVLAARRAAWFVLLIAVVIQIFVYLVYLGMEQGWMDGLIELGLYGNITRDEMAQLTFFCVAALKLMNTAILLGAIFLTLWVRGLRRIG